ncbi:MAG: hypothetical protein JO100_08895 [Pseudonocardia sp.]|nr:hypothetical protein [Pseudonocardia sp.]
MFVSGSWSRTPLTWDSVANVFVGELPAQGPGLYDVQVRAGRCRGAGIWSARIRWRCSRVAEAFTWRLTGEPLGLLRAAHPRAVAQYVGIPDPAADTERSHRLTRLYEELAKRRIGYVLPPPEFAPGTQVIRPPEQVLGVPRHGTCLDLAVVLAAGCLRARLRPAIAVLTFPDGRGFEHAIVLVNLGTDTQRGAGGAAELDVWHSCPKGWLHELDAAFDGSGDVVAIDPMGFAVQLGPSAHAGLDVGLPAAVANGAAYLRKWTWRVGVDVGSGWRSSHEPPPDRLLDEPLRKPYRTAGSERSPLRLLRAEYQLVPFRSRDELTILLDWW